MPTSTNLRTFGLALGGLLVLCGASLPAAEPDPEASIHQRILLDAKVKIDDASLLEVFRKRTLNETDRLHIKENIRLLGARTYAVREKAQRDLLRVGKMALVPLKEATQSPDLEVARRAERILQEMEQGGDAAVLISAAYLIGVRQPKEGVATLLTYLPSSTDSSVVDGIQSALVRLAIKEGKVEPAILKALDDKEAVRRVAAAYVVSKGDTRQRQALRPYLNDKDLEVRFHAATALVRNGEPQAVEALFTLLREAPVSLAAQAEDLLYRVAGSQAPSLALGTDASARESCVAGWKTWWKANSSKIDWKHLNLEDAYLGLTLICEAQMPGSRGRIYEVGADGKVRWEVASNNPIDMQMLPGERLLIAEHGGGQVFETDRSGKVLWSYRIENPVSCQRLPNGNTFIANYNKVLEVTRDGKVLYSWQRNVSSQYYACKLRNGHILCCHSGGELIELDGSGKEVMRLNVGGYSKWAGAEVLPSGHFLLARAGADEITEIDRTGKVLWRCRVANPNAATRLRNGHTLVASHDDQAIYEFDSTGKVVWKQKMQGRPFRVRRR